MAKDTNAETGKTGDRDDILDAHQIAGGHLVRPQIKRSHCQRKLLSLGYSLFEIVGLHQSMFCKMSVLAPNTVTSGIGSALVRSVPGTYERIARAGGRSDPGDIQPSLPERKALQGRRAGARHHGCKEKGR
jgi:hypothetical protein